MESTTKTFDNCALYVASGFMGNIVRYDCRSATITEGERYAQYLNAIKVEYTPKGARRRHGFYITYKPFLVVLASKDAIEPPSMFGEAAPGSTPGATLLAGRYSCFDKRWESDFMEALINSNITPLYLVGNDYNTLGQLPS